MTISMVAPPLPTTHLDGVEYVPGECNIGPAEITRRRRAGHVGAVITIGALAVLVAIGAPPLARLLVALPAAAAASGYLQAYLRFCAGFGSRGEYNFSELGVTQHIEDAEARKRDRSRSRRIGAAAGAIGLLVGLIAVVLPL
jgi:hypothetical protein